MSQRVARISGYQLPPDVPTYGHSRAECEEAITASVNMRLGREEVHPDNVKRVVREEEAIFWEWLASRGAPS